MLAYWIDWINLALDVIVDVIASSAFDKVKHLQRKSVDIPIRVVYPVTCSIVWILLAPLANDSSACGSYFDPGLYRRISAYKSQERRPTH